MKNHIPRFIYLFGPDGSGKSTHARILARYLARNGMKVKVVWVKSHHTLAFVILKILSKIRPCSLSLNPSGSIIQIHGISNGSIGRLIWSLIELISIIPWVLLRVYFPLMMGKFVIAERYTVDSIISIAYSINEPEFVKGFIAKLLLGFIPKDSLLIHLDSTYEEILCRRGDETDPKEYITFQRSTYPIFSKELCTLTVDTSHTSISEIAALIRDHLFKQTPK